MCAWNDNLRLQERTCANDGGGVINTETRDGHGAKLRSNSR